MKTVPPWATTMAVLLSTAIPAAATGPGAGAPVAARADGTSVPAATAQAVPLSTPADAFWKDTWRGWHFYEEPEAEPAPAAAPMAPARPAPPPTRSLRPPRPAADKPPELIAFARLQQALEDARHIAVMVPSEANVRRYMQLESAVTARASAFADMAQRIAWADPSLDPTLQGRPVNAQALEVFEQLQVNERSRSVAALARDHVLLFFFRGDCPYCHAFAPTLQGFAQQHGLKILAVSLDGGHLPGLADQRRDNGIARTLQVTQVPALYLAQPFTGTITPIGFGVLSQAQLLERVAQAAAGPPGAPAGADAMDSSEGPRERTRPRTATLASGRPP